MQKDRLKEMYHKLYEAVLCLESEAECAALFEDLFTIAELNAAAQRMEVASRLYAGETCNGVSEKLGASTATVSRVNKCLNYGTGGYELVLKRLAGRDAE